MSPPRLSVVIPAYNEAERLPRTLGRVSAYLSKRELDYEIVVVDDGSTDGTAERVRAAGESRLVVLRHEPNRGKGYAVRRGMLAARGTLRLMTDADLSTPIEDLARLEAALEAGYDVAIGSRAVAGANVEVHQPWYREAMGRLFNLLVRALALPGLFDTQCGFKLFTAAAAEIAFSRAVFDGFSFDVEALFIARRAHLRIAEVPVTWRNDAATRVGLVHGGLAFLDLLRIRSNGWAGRYGPPGPAGESAGIGDGSPGGSSRL
jgi:dolichyl-phosphate beta-glucosyltransferase